MRIVRGLESYPPDALSSAVALGAFDGVHLGHRAILGTAVAQARREGLVALACTFDPHPLEVLQFAREVGHERLVFGRPGWTVTSPAVLREFGGGLSAPEVDDIVCNNLERLLQPWLPAR